MKFNKIAILGAGNMGSSIANGLVKSSYIRSENITLSDIDTTKLTEYKKKKFSVTSDPKLAIKDAEIIIIAVKPNIVEPLLKNIKSVLNPKKHIILSIAAGVSSESIQKITGKLIPLILVMPNTAIAIQQSVTCLSTPNAKKEILNSVSEMFEKLGKCFIIDESLMSAATVIGSCGTAFALRFIRASALGGIEIGFKPDMAKQIASQVVLGAAGLILANNSNPEDEIDKVTTPKGITITGLNEMEHNGFSSAIIKGVRKSYEKVNGKK